MGTTNADTAHVVAVMVMAMVMALRRTGLTHANIAGNMLQVVRDIAKQADDEESKGDPVIEH